ncbi:MAG: DUF695 domain-containing protein, partial [Chitinophagales bacterium]
TSTFSQTDNWSTYIAQWEGKPGSVILNMDLIKTAPDLSLNYLLVTGVNYSCGDDGFPIDSEWESLYAVSDSVSAIISKMTSNEMAGTYTYQCDRYDYIYLKDTTGIRKALSDLYKTKFDNYKYYIKLEKDANWRAYIQFLYPTEEILRIMNNQKVLDQLVAQGDDLSKPRQVDHWIYFKDKKDRENFAKKVKTMNYKVESMNIVSSTDYIYQLQISREDLVNIDSITKITDELRKLALEYNGDYDGWETFVIKK